MSYLGPTNPARGLANEELSHEQELELERTAERYAELHGRDDPSERPPGIVARIRRRLTRRRRD
jgi:hypothetical protein